MTKMSKRKKNVAVRHRASYIMDKDKGVDTPIVVDGNGVAFEEEDAPIELPYGGATSSPTASAPSASATKAEGLGASAKIEQAARHESDQRKKQFDQTEKQIKQTDKEIKNTEALKKVMEGLLKTIKEGDTAPTVTAKPNDPLAVAPEKQKGLVATIRGALGGAVKGKLEPVKNLTSAKGLTGLVAARYGGNPNSIIGGIASALHEREIAKQDEKAKQDSFHTGYLTGTDSGRDLLYQKKMEAAQALQKEKPKLKGAKFDAEVEKRAQAAARETTDGLYERKKAQEEAIAKLNEKETALKNKDKLFGLSAEETKQRDTMIAERAKLVTGTSAERMKAESVIAEPLPKEESEAIDSFDAKRTKKISEFKWYHQRDPSDKEVNSIDAAIEKELKEHKELLKKIAENTSDQKDTAAEMMEAGMNNTAEDIAAKMPESSAKAQNESKKGFLDRSKGVLGKGKDMLSKGAESIFEKIASGSVGKLGSTIVSALAPMAVPAAAVTAAGAVGYGAGKLINKGWEAVTGNSVGNSIANVFKSDAEKQLDEENAKYEAAQKARIQAPKVEAPQAQPIMEKAPRDVKPIIDEKSAILEKAKADKPIVVSQPNVSAPVINNNNSTTTVVRAPIRNQEPSFNRSLQRNFI